jgi:hypothetical protein
MAANDPLADALRPCCIPRMTHDDEARFDERVRKLVKHKPVEKPE